MRVQTNARSRDSGVFHRDVDHRAFEGETRVFATFWTDMFPVDRMRSAPGQNIGGVHAQATTATVLPILRKV